jgi:hypothetical protein
VQWRNEPFFEINGVDMSDNLDEATEGVFEQARKLREQLPQTVRPSKNRNKFSPYKHNPKPSISVEDNQTAETESFTE